MLGRASLKWPILYWVGYKIVSQLRSWAVNVGVTFGHPECLSTLPINMGYGRDEHRYLFTTRALYAACVFLLPCFQRCQPSCFWRNFPAFTLWFHLSGRDVHIPALHDLPAHNHHHNLLCLNGSTCRWFDRDRKASNGLETNVHAYYK